MLILIRQNVKRGLNDLEGLPRPHAHLSVRARPRRAIRRARVGADIGSRRLRRRHSDDNLPTRFDLWTVEIGITAIPANAESERSIMHQGPIDPRQSFDLRRHLIAGPRITRHLIAGPRSTRHKAICSRHIDNGRGRLRGRARAGNSGKRLAGRPAGL